MNLQGSIKELQKRGAQLYLELSRRFSENGLIRDTWIAMAHDESQQIRSLDALPRSFWNRLRREQEEALKPISSHFVSGLEGQKDKTISGCFGCALGFEERITLEVYVPVVRCLKKEWTDRSLDLYITVRAHLARIVRITEAFAGDPLLVGRATALLQNFEKGIQEARQKSRLLKGKGGAARRARASTSVGSRGKARLKALGRAHSPARRSKTLTSRSKPLVKKVSLRRQRARR